MQRKEINILAVLHYKSRPNDVSCFGTPKTKKVDKIMKNTGNRLSLPESYYLKTAGYVRRFYI